MFDVSTEALELTPGDGAELPEHAYSYLNLSRWFDTSYHDQDEDEDHGQDENEDEDLKGMSFAFNVPTTDGEEWEQLPGRGIIRTITRADLFECSSTQVRPVPARWSSTSATWTRPSPGSIGRHT
jgi:hypothetical protein